MELIAKSSCQLNATDAWSKTIAKKEERILESYGNYPELCGLLHKYIKSQDHTLILGANNSSLGESLYGIGYHSLVTVDSDENSVKKLAVENETERPEMKFESMDITKMTFNDDSFKAILDRGTIDSLVRQATDDVQGKLSALFRQIDRVLKLGGRFICVSFAQDDVAKQLIEYFSNEGWPVRVHKLPDTDQCDGDFQPPVYVFVCTKFKKMPQMTKKILEICVDENRAAHRYENIEEILRFIQETQQYVVVRHSMTKRTHTDESISIVYCNCTTDQPRYTLHVVDSATARKGGQKFGIFIVPEGRETDWLFDSEAGRAIVHKQAGFQRLLICCLHRDNTYENLDAIKKELSSKVLELAPPGLNKDKDKFDFVELRRFLKNPNQPTMYISKVCGSQDLSHSIICGVIKQNESELANIDSKIQPNKVPFLTIDNNLGYREVRFRGNSDFCGGFVVEDVRNGEGAMVRRLVFLTCTDAVQSEIRLLEDEKPKKKGKQNTKQKSSQEVRFDYSYLPSEYQRYQVAGIATIPQFQSLLDDRFDMLIIGLGGGIIPMFIYTHFPKVHLDVVDIDPAVVDAAKNWFGCPEDERMTLYAEDGLKFIKDRAEQGGDHRYHDVIFDVNTQDFSVGMSCPPKAFVELELLQLVKDKILHPQGVFQLNIVARNKDLKEKVIQDIKSVFPLVLRNNIEGCVNEILYAFPQESALSDKDLMASLKKSGVTLQKIAKASKIPVDSETDLSEVLQQLDIQ